MLLEDAIKLVIKAQKNTVNEVLKSVTRFLKRLNHARFLCKQSND